MLSWLKASETEQREREREREERYRAVSGPENQNKKKKKPASLFRVPLANPYLQEIMLVQVHTRVSWSRLERERRMEKKLRKERERAFTYVQHTPMVETARINEKYS